MTIKYKKYKKTNTQKYLINLLSTKILTNTVSFKSKIKIFNVFLILLIIDFVIKYQKINKLKIV